MSKAQLFNSVYGVFRDDVSETVVECHVSRLRKRLRDALGQRSDRIAAPLLDIASTGVTFAARLRAQS